MRRQFSLLLPSEPVNLAKVKCGRGLAKDFTILQDSHTKSYERNFFPLGESSFAKVPLSVSVYDNTASTNNFSWKLLLESDQQEIEAIQ